LRLMSMKLAPQIALAAATLAAVAAALFLWLGGSSSDGIEIILPEPTPPPELRAYVSGAVLSPGVYAVSQGDRLAQLIEAAGGPTDDADLSAVNLAARVGDEDHWHVPRQGEVTAPPAVRDAGPGRSTVGSTTESAKIRVNTADAKELTNLPRIGEIIAQRIIDYRDANGPFSSVEELLAVQGIGPATLAAIRDLVEVR